MKGLCFRCEHRAIFLEQKFAPRHECSQTENAISSCYMYRPVSPCITKPANPKDPRPRFGIPVLSSRERYAGVADLKLKVVELKEGIALVYS